MAKKITDAEKALVGAFLKLHMEKRTEGKWSGKMHYAAGTDGKRWTDGKVGKRLDISGDKVRRVREEIYGVSHHKTVVPAVQPRLDPVEQAIENAVRVQEYDAERLEPALNGATLDENVMTIRVGMALLRAEITTISEKMDALLTIWK